MSRLRSTESAADSAQFLGTIALSETNSVGVLLVAEGDTVTVTYQDADDGSGSPATTTATAIVDCTPPVISGVELVDVDARSATITFDTDEPARGIIYYGLSCGNLNQTAEGSGYSTSPIVEVTDLESGVTYYFAVGAEDQAGNPAYDDNAGSCYSFTTPAVPVYFTEQYEGDFDLAYSSVVFAPDGSEDFYDGCVEGISEFPTDPAGGTEITLTDDGFVEVAVSDGETVSLYGVEYSSFYVGANGFITFGGGDTAWSESLENHFDMPRISVLFRDFSPQNGGTVSYKQLTDRVVVTYENCPEYPNVGLNTFQVEMHFDGTIVLSYLAMDATYGVTGLSAGNGVPGDFYETDLSEMSRCCPGDLDGDGDVDLSDLAQLLSNYGMTQGATYEDGDLDGDGDVDLADLAALLAVYGTTCD